MGAEEGAVPVPQDLNEVTVRGRVSGAPLERTMPSGDALVSFRIVVGRPPRARRRSRVTVDTIDCVAWTAAIRRKAAALASGDVVEVSGALRRRFRRVEGVPTSRVDVEVVRCRRVSRVPR